MRMRYVASPVPTVIFLVGLDTALESNSLIIWKELSGSSMSGHQRLFHTKIVSDQWHQFPDL